MFRFEDPYFLLLLLFIPLMIYYYIVKQGSLKIKYSSLNLIKALKVRDSKIGQHALFALRLITVILLIICLARPQIHNKVREIISSGIDIMLVLDTSGSMETQDYQINNLPTTRLTVVKDVVREFITKRPGDRLGMIVFGTYAFTQCPITLDHEILINFLKDIHIAMAGESTSIGSAIGIGVKRLKDIKAKSKIIILLTDGRSNTGQIAPLTAAELAKTFGIKIYTVGVGTKDLTNLGINQMLRGYSTTQLTLDEDTLRKIAEITGGLYFKATDTQGLKEIYNTIDKMEKTQIKVKEYGKDTELFPGILTLALIAFLTELLLANTLFTKIP